MDGFYSDLPHKYWELVELMQFCRQWIYSDVLNFDLITEFYIRIMKIEIMMFEFLT